MRFLTPIVALVLAATATVARAHSDVMPPVTVSCGSAVMVDPPAEPNRERVLFGQVAVPPRSLPQVERGSGPWPYWRKAGLLVRAGASGVSLSVPPSWRGRVRIIWGDSGEVPAVRFARCSRPPNEWNLYTGGFVLRRPACVPLVVRVGSRVAHVRFGVGATCAAAVRTSG
jgi:hypothetical protein